MAAAAFESSCTKALVSVMGGLLPLEKPSSVQNSGVLHADMKRNEKCKVPRCQKVGPLEGYKQLCTAAHECKILRALCGRKTLKQFRHSFEKFPALLDTAAN